MIVASLKRYKKYQLPTCRPALANAQEWAYKRYMPVDFSPAITVGLAAVRAALAVRRTVADLLKYPTPDAKAIAEHLLQLQEHISSAREALEDAAEEIQRLKADLAQAKQHTALEEDLVIDTEARFYIRKSERDAGRNIGYCPVCWATDEKLVPLAPHLDPGRFQCIVHHSEYRTQEYKFWRQQRDQENARAMREYNERIAEDSWMG